MQTLHPKKQFKTKNRVRNALRYSFFEGLLSTLTISIVDPFVIPAIMALGAGDMAVAALSGSGLLMSGLSHLVTPSVAARVSTRRTFVIACVRMQALACLFLAGAGFLGKIGLVASVVAYAIYCSAGSLTYSLWASWMGDLVPATGRSRYYSLRSFVYGPAGGLITLGLGFLFNYLWGGRNHAPQYAFSIVFCMAFAFRFGGSLLLKKQYEPPVRSDKTPPDDFTYFEFLKRAKGGNFAVFTIFFALLHAGSGLTGPFFASYALRDLNCSYVEYVMFTVWSIVSAMVLVRFWGRMADRWGNLFVIRVCALLLSMVPLLYLGDGKKLWPLYLGWVIGGGVWAGINLASFNFVTATATPRRRVRCYAYLQTTVGLAVALYMFVWGALTEYLPILFQYKLQTVFLCSAFLRLIPALGLIYIVKDRKPIPDAKISEFLAEVPLMLPNGQIMRELLRPLIKPQRLWNMAKK